MGRMQRVLRRAQSAPSGRSEGDSAQSRRMPGRMSAAALVAVLGSVLMAAACDKETAPVPVPTPIATPTITESYSGTLHVFGSNLHSFEVKQSSQVLVTLTSVVTVPVAADPTADPPIVAIPATPLTQPLLLHVGRPTLTTLGVQCSQLKAVEAAAGTTPQLTGQALAGTFCVSITDVTGTLPRAVTYAITVAHS